MCGRYALFGPKSRPRTLHPYFAGLEDFPGAYNVAPTLIMPVARLTHGNPELFRAKWGLVPCWSHDWKIGYKMINARAETLATSKAYGAPYRRRQRCLVPASGFYEWQKMAAGKQPYFITSAGDELLAFAGLWEQWAQPGAEPLVTYTVITGKPNALVAPLHDRMPVIIDPSDYERWLTADDPADLLQPYPAELMRAYPVSTRVNSPKNDDESLVERM
ncbi:MAG TPA: SOS response-associated peptidase [Burkholderiales bacterium]|nr:SOS response-associated peptidase [Burkholderiales bacterium]